MGQSVLVPGSAGSGAAITRDAFEYRDGILHCEDVSLVRLADAVGTPAFVYSSAMVADSVGRFDGALRDVPHRIHYSVKANSNLALLQLIRSLGAAADVVSGGELRRALRAGFKPEEIVFGGVGKNDQELAAAVISGIKLVNVESVGELKRLSAIAESRGSTIDVGLRINPEVLVDTPHPYTRTGERGMKFGIPLDAAAAAARVALELPGVRLSGIDVHIGSQISALQPYLSAFERLSALVAELVALGAQLRYLDIGGGMGVTYNGEPELDLAMFAEAAGALARSTGLELILEPGRSVVGNAGVILASVIERKHSGGKDFVIVDAGMNDLLRPSHYNSYHRISPLREGTASGRYDIVGPVCESGDFLGLDRELPPLSPGDALAVHGTGAYGFVMSSNYNSRPRAAEVLVRGGSYAVVRERETEDDLYRGETTEPEWSQS